MDVAVSDREVVKLLERGTVRRVRAIERAVETPEGPVGGREVWMEFGGESCTGPAGHCQGTEGRAD